MAAALSFRFLQGHRAQGCVRVSGEEMLLSLQGLDAGPRALYRVEDGHASEAPEPPQASAAPEVTAPGHVLRAPGDGPPVTALPALLWPDEVRPLQPYFEAHVPFAPYFCRNAYMLQVASLHAYFIFFPRQYRIDEAVRMRMNFARDATAKIEGLLPVNQDFCGQQIA